MTKHCLFPFLVACIVAGAACSGETTAPDADAGGADASRPSTSDSVPGSPFGADASITTDAGRAPPAVVDAGTREEGGKKPPPPKGDGGYDYPPDSEDASAPADASAPVTADAAPPVDAAAPVNGCTAYEDETASARVDLAWGFSISSAPSRCTVIKAGTKVVFKGSFSSHPLDAFGGDAPSPFRGASARVTGAGTADEAVETTFATAGTFGFHCTIHASMKGAIRVVP